MKPQNAWLIQEPALFQKANGLCYRKLAVPRHCCVTLSTRNLMFGSLRQNYHDFEGDG
ncbi:hypothetical protein SLEP1_g33915 [Rubroshorea leprosula]|uniref:Uncharacterized protein n=1 Tax=Rubroshorea leprosula TaxID=152421 RepID=A0AAV5KI46_9ROSI|nr:hypothetical protein SLEP1_g33915 [Rubroshorea leprosula]